jgi:hypothetical protein
MRKTALVLVALAALFVVMSVSAFADSAQINATVTIPNSCGIWLSAATVAFGTVGTGNTSSEQSVELNNTGSVPGNYTIHGINWYSGANSINVSQTKFANVTGTYASKTALTLVDQVFQNLLGNGFSTNLFLQMAVPNGQASGTYQQNITLTSTC